MNQETHKINYVSVTNRNNGVTSYTLGSGVYRSFNLRETKKIDIEELKELRATDGGEYILRNYLLINDKDALDFLDIQTEPEYFYTEDQIKEILLNGSLEQLEDCLNFAPNGVIELVKSMGVALQVPDIRKRDLILEKTGFSVDNAIKVNKVLEEDTAPVVEEQKIQRKAVPISVDKKPERKYNIQTKKES